MDEIIKRIKHKISARGIQLNPCLEVSDIAMFEAKYGVRLPEEYRRFLLEIGNGEVGRVGIESVLGLGQAPDCAGGSEDYREMYEHRIQKHLARLVHSFPFTEPWVWEDEDWDEEKLRDKQELLYNGNLLLRDDGCGMTWHLIVTGPERGNIWHFADVGIEATSRKRDFLTWYEDCLDGVEDWWA